MKYGIIDIGANTIRAVVYEISGGSFECIFNRKQFVQLIGYVNGGRMRDEGKRSMLYAVKQLADSAGQLRPKKIDCFATAPFRAVDDPDELTAMVRTLTGLSVSVLSGEEEARLQLIGSRYLHAADDGLFVDLGGGSMEAGLLSDGSIVHAQSVDIGCVNLSGQFVSGILPTKKEFRKLKRYIDKRLGEMPWLEDAQGRDMICTGGTARALAEIHKSLSGSAVPVDAYEMDVNELKGVCETLMDMDIEGVRLITKHASGRIFTFVPGVAALWRMAKAAGAERVKFSTYGVREGYLIKNVLKSAKFGERPAKVRPETDEGYGKQKVV